MRDVTQTLLELLSSADISSYVFEEPFAGIERFDLGLRMLLLQTEERYAPVLRRIRRLKPESLYLLEDTFHVHYAIIKLPDEGAERWLSVGPMLITPPGGEEILALLKELRLPDSLYHALSMYYERLPRLRQQELFEIIGYAVADTVFGRRDAYERKVIHNSAEPDDLQQLIARSRLAQEESREERFRDLERRYELENALLAAVRGGDEKASLAAYSRFLQFVGGLKRLPDRLRDSKDLSITLNTLLRKCAEDAGVHPYYIDSFSNINVVRLEQCVNEIQIASIGRELVRGYCELIRQYALSSFSKPVRDALFLIQSDLSADLSLTAIADTLNLNRSYLSTLLARELGMPLSAYVLEKRILRAQHLLSSTPLSIQEIAWEVGIPDANYFARLFKRETGMTPKHYREENRRRLK